MNQGQIKQPPSTNHFVCEVGLASRRHAIGWILGGITLPWLGGCGGGGGESVVNDDGSTGSGVGTATRAVGYGTITGFGSIIINGVRYDDSQAIYGWSDDSRPFDRRELGLGMIARVEGSINADGISGRADRVEIGAVLRGPVQAVDSATGVLTVLGIRVQTSSQTVWSDLAGLGAVQPNTTWVEIYALDDVQQGLIATRIESKLPGYFSLRGPVQSVQGTQVRVRGIDVAWPNGQSLPATGQWVKVGGVLTLPVPSVLVATEARILGASPLGSLVAVAGVRAEIEGIVESRTGTLCQVQGIACELGPNVASVPISVGDLVEFKGYWGDGGRLVVDRVEWRSRDWSGEEYQERIELKGVITEVNGNVITVLGQSVEWDANTIFSGAVPTQLVAGQYVEVKGIYKAQVLRASKIEVKGSASQEASGSGQKTYGGYQKIKGAIQSRNGNVITVNGLSIDISRAYFEHGSAQQLVPGVWVEVKGEPTADGMLAYKVEVEWGDD